MIDIELWRETVKELGCRSCRGTRESGAFLLAASDGDRRLVAEVCFFDDLDPDCLVGNIHIRSHGFAKLWGICEKKGLWVIADVHTHPGESVTQSAIDQLNPMVARDGHLALIVPQYGTRPVRASEVGVHQYRGDKGWKSWVGPNAEWVMQISDGRFGNA